MKNKSQNDELQTKEKKKRSKIPLAIFGTAVVVAGIVIPPLLVKNCQAKKTISLNNITINQLSTEAKNLKITINGLENELESKQAKIDALNDELDKAKKLINSHRNKLYELTGSESETYDLGVDGEKALSGSLIYILRQKIQDRDNTINDKDSEIEQFKAQLADALGQISSLKDEITNKNAEIENLNEQLKAANSDIERIKMLLEESNSENSKLRQQIKDLIAETQKQKEALEFKIAQIEGDNATKQRIIDEQKQELSNLNDKIAQLEALIEQQKETINQNNQTIATLIADKEANKNALLDSIVSYRQSLKDLIAKVNETKNVLIDSVDENLGTHISEAKNNAAADDQAKYDEILKSLFSKENMKELIKNGTTKLNLIKKYNDEISDDELTNITINSKWDISNFTDDELAQWYSKYLDLSDDDFKTSLIENGTVKKDEYDKFLSLFESLKDKANHNLDVLNQAKTQNLVALANSYTNLETLLETLSTKYHELVGETPLESELKPDEKNAIGGIVKELRDQIKNLKLSLASAESKLLALYGNTEHDFDLGNDGENAANGSYIKVLYDKLKYKEQQFAAKRIELNKVARELEEKKDELAEKDDEIRTLKEQATQLNQQISNLNSQIQSKNQEISSKSQEISHLNDQISEKDAEIERLREENERYRIDTTGNSQELERLRAENRQKQARIEELERENSRLQSSISSLTRERDRALNDVTYWRDRYYQVNPNPSGSSDEELKKVKARLIELTGVDNPDYDLGTDGADAKAGSYIYNLNAKIQQLTRDRDDYKSKYEIAEQNFQDLKRLQGSMWNHKVIFGTETESHKSREIARAETIIGTGDNMSGKDVDRLDSEWALTKRANWGNIDEVDKYKYFYNFNSQAKSKFTINFNSFDEIKNYRLRIGNDFKTIQEWTQTSRVALYDNSYFAYFTVGQKIRDYSVIRTEKKTEYVTNGYNYGYNKVEKDVVAYRDDVHGFQMSKRSVQYSKNINIEYSKTPTSITFTITETIGVGPLSDGKNNEIRKYIAFLDKENKSGFNNFTSTYNNELVLFDSILLPEQFMKPIKEIILVRP
ncbi:hypothetical protein [Mycoplasmopsis pullorum]|uniref:Uncharacterized protein n=1 Tax=Mycoplasmopsis pullorum TaxID=48003 RepID=A0A1L4FSW3_9BACT|nr:hypothetical protein [Mycoplasmopsis pullorum]APJ38689.1 hypothetical protein BLA55_03450 [Mycoplasmopsis pullorum]